MPLTATRPHTTAESTLSCRDTCLPLLAKDLARVQYFVETIPRRPGKADVPALVLAARALLILGRERQARLHLDQALEIGGLPALVLGTLALPSEGPALGLLRLARPDSVETHAEAHCDLAVIALRQADLGMAASHIEAARNLAPEMREPMHWKRLVEVHADCLARWLSGRRARFSPLAARRLLDCWPDATNGYLAPIRLHRRARCAQTLPEQGQGCVMKKYPAAFFPPPSPSLPAPPWPAKRKHLPAESKAC